MPELTPMPELVPEVEVQLEVVVVLLNPLLTQLQDVILFQLGLLTDTTK